MAVGNRAKNKPWAKAIDRALAHAGAKFADDVDENGHPLGPKSKALKTIARQIVDGALAGDMTCIREIADRVDGKPAQQQILTGADDGPIQIEQMSEKELDERIVSLVAELGIEKGALRTTH